MNEDAPTETPAYKVLAEASYDGRHLLFVRHYPLDDGLLIGCVADGNRVLAKTPASNLRAVIQALAHGLDGSFEVPMDKGFSVLFQTGWPKPDVLVLSLHDDPNQGRMGVTLDAALTMMALGGGAGA